MIEYKENLLSADAFIALRRSVGWNAEFHQIEKALKGTPYSICAMDGEHCIGMARLIGDGASIWYVQDVIVLPGYQRKGIGNAMVQMLLKHVEKHSLPGTAVTVGLMAAKGKEGFYEKLGFHTRPNDSEGAGMLTRVFAEHLIFDVHTHAFPDGIAARAVETLSQKSSGLPYHHDGTYAGLAAYEARGGACGFLILPIATAPRQTRSVNDWAAAHVGQGGAHSFGSVHPDCENMEAVLDHIVELGLPGIKFHPEYQAFEVDEPRMLDIYRAATERGLILCFHAGVDIGFPPPHRGNPRRIAAVCDAIPGARIIAAHMGGFRMGEEATAALLGRPNVWLDTSFSALEMPPGELRDMIRAHGPERVMFGTDAPWTDFQASLNAVTGCGLTGEELGQVLYRSAAALLGLDKTGL